MILKGWAVGRLYPKPELRTSKDLDIYQFGDWKKSDSLLQKELNTNIQHKGVHHTKYLFHDLTVENHYDFVGSNNMRSNRRYESLLKAYANSAVQDCSLLNEPTCLAGATFEALFLMRHMAGHFASERIIVRHLCDWAVFLQHRRHEVDWDFVAQTFRSFGMMPFVGALQGIVEDIFGIAPPAPAASRRQGTATACAARDTRRRVSRDPRERKLRPAVLEAAPLPRQPMEVPHLLQRQHGKHLAPQHWFSPQKAIQHYPQSIKTMTRIPLQEQLSENLDISKITRVRDKRNGLK